MQNIYIVCMIIGIALPLLSLVFDFLDSAFDFLALEFLDLDLGDFTISFLPLSMNSLCMASLAFGTVSLLLSELDIVKRHIIAGVIAYILAVFIQSIINYLKKNSMDADMIDSILERKCFVCNKIKSNGFGSIVCKADGKSDINITAKGVGSLLSTLIIILGG